MKVKEQKTIFNSTDLYLYQIGTDWIGIIDSNTCESESMPILSKEFGEIDGGELQPSKTVSSGKNIRADGC